MTSISFFTARVVWPSSFSPPRQLGNPEALPSSPPSCPLSLMLTSGICSSLLTCSFLTALLPMGWVGSSFLAAASWREGGSSLGVWLGESSRLNLWFGGCSSATVMERFMEEVPSFRGVGLSAGLLVGESRLGDRSSWPGSSGYLSARWRAGGTERWEHSDMARRMAFRCWEARLRKVPSG